MAEASVLILGQSPLSSDLVAAFTQLGVSALRYPGEVEAKSLEELLAQVDPNFVVPVEPLTEEFIAKLFSQATPSFKEALQAAEVAVVPSLKAACLTEAEVFSLAHSLGLPTLYYELDQDGQVVTQDIDSDYHICLLLGRSIDAASSLSSWFCQPIGRENQVSWQPVELSTCAMESARSIAARLVNALGGRGVYTVELTVRGDDVFFAGLRQFPQLCCALTAKTQRLSHCQLHARAILGLSLDATLITPGAAVTTQGTRLNYEQLSTALQEPESDLLVYPVNDERYHVCVATAESVAVAVERAEAMQLHC